jgi:nitrite reductase (NADH) large subunit
MVTSTQISQSMSKRRVVVIGNGMVGCRVLQSLARSDETKHLEIATFAEEEIPAYDRVHLSEYFNGSTVQDLTLKPLNWYLQNNVHILLGHRVEKINREERYVESSRGIRLGYDQLVIATGSYPFVPTIEGIDKPGVFVYRTLEDLDAIMAYAKGRHKVAVMGGGLLGLEAANAMLNLGLHTTVVEYAPRLMPRQLDEAGAGVLTQMVEGRGIAVKTGANTKRIVGEDGISGMEFADGSRLSVDMVVVSAGIRPRDSLANDCGLELGSRGGIAVDASMRTSDPNIFAVGEVASFDGVTYGLVAPGYEMADVAVNQIFGGTDQFETPDLSTVLKLVGVDVASFGDALEEGEGVRSLCFQDTVSGIYKKLVLSPDGKRLLGGVLVGDAREYNDLLQLMRNEIELPRDPASLIMGKMDSADSLVQIELPASAQICSCENVTKGDIVECIGRGAESIAQIKDLTRAGTGCGGCGPMLSNILKSEMSGMGRSVVNHLCEHFPYTRSELLTIIRTHGYRQFNELVQGHGKGSGCEICKPVAASIFASIWNEPVDDHESIQDTNDRFMANIQRGGTYSVVPRVPGGEISPEKLIVLGEVAKRYGLYTKITGGQRIDLFGARVEQLPDIWEELIQAGFESGHAYGKALRTIKSCVGTNWCRFAVGDSVGLAIELENRYRGIRSPHKLKSAVSGCIRECAEAQSKDFGVIATDKGWNLYVGGNGGANPRHAELLATDLDEQTLIQYIDRYLMYYIHDADKLQRTARWIEAMEGGVARLREVVCEDVLGIGEQLEKEMAKLVDSYECEWTQVVNDPQRRERFSHYVNSDAADSSVHFVKEREHVRPADWADRQPEESRATLPIVGQSQVPAMPTDSWVDVGHMKDFPKEGGACVKYHSHQIAVFQFETRGQWYAAQNMCPHKYDMVLSRGLTGTEGELPKVACPQHKKTFSLESGEGLSDPSLRIRTYEIRLDGTRVLIKLPDWMKQDEASATVSEAAQSCQHAVSAQS